MRAYWSKSVLIGSYASLCVVMCPNGFLWVFTRLHGF